MGGSFCGVRFVLAINFAKPNRFSLLRLTFNVKRYTLDGVIKSFRSKDTELLHKRQRVPRFRSIERVAQRKLRQLDSAVLLSDLNSPPGNRLESLKRDREGQHSIRVNEKWRICFRWHEGDAYDVEIVDYH